MKISYKVFFIFIISILLNQHFLFSQNREVVRIATYNILNYPDSYTQRNGSFITVLDEVEPDILVVQEITSLFGVNTFQSEVLGAKFVAGDFINGDDTDNAIFYKDSLMTMIDNRNISTALRDISEYTLVHNFSGDTLIIYSVHLKASDTETDRQKRLAEVTVLRNITDILPIGTNFMVIGDFNIYYANEPAYQKLIEQVDPGYFIDPLLAGNWHNNIAYASIHTQSTMTTSHWGGSTGGMDDRFDMILLSQAVSDTGGITYVDGSSVSFGNDGQHFNKAINEPPFTIITQQVANALNNSSDHLPVYADFDFGIISDVEIIAADEMNFILHQNYPNPFNPSTTIKFSIPGGSQVSLMIYNSLGQEIKTLVNRFMEAGVHTVNFNAVDLNSGMYFYRLAAGEFTQVRKMTLIK